MTAVVVYESMWGSTKAVAEAIAEGLEARGPVRLVEVGDAGELGDDVDLVVVGGPTHAFGMTRESTRADAAKDHPPVISSTGVREWLEAAHLPAGVGYAAFDTKVAKPNLPGSAAKAIDKALHKLGARRVADATTFRVNGKWDGLVDGELARARGWGASLAATKP